MSDESEKPTELETQRNEDDKLATQNSVVSVKSEDQQQQSVKEERQQDSPDDSNNETLKDPSGEEHGKPCCLPLTYAILAAKAEFPL